jgi:hypothetical protein
MSRGRAQLVVVATVIALSASAQAQQLFTYRGACDASAGIALDAQRFAVANDENNGIGYFRQGEAEGTGALDLGAFLRIKKGEADIEGAAPTAGRTYWITSHGRSSSGKRQPSRQRFFATETRSGASLAPAGVPYTRLLDDLTAAPDLARYRLAEASRRAAEAPGGLNIEGLAMTPNGGVLVGFRNPLHEGRALVVPLDNPAQMIEGERAKLGTPIELDLGGRGIRSMELVGSSYLIVAGPTADEGTFALYRWSGKREDAPVPLNADLRDLRPEGLFAIPGTSSVQLLSDDGGIRIDGAECKSLPMTRQAFRAMTLAF